MKPPSRPKRLQMLEHELRQLATEYQAWRDAMPENLTESALAEKLEETVEVLESIADDLWAVDPPCIGIRY